MRTTCHTAGVLLCIAFLSCLIHPAQAQVISTVAGNGHTGYYGDNGPATAAALDSPGCVAVDAAGNLYISDQLNNCVRKVTAAGIITTIAGTGTAGYNGDNIAATAAQLSANWGIAIDQGGNIYVADQGNNRVRKINTAGIITTIAGNGLSGYYGDGGPATAAQINHPIGVAADGIGNVYIGDADNYRVRRVNTSGTISTVAGTGAGGYYGDGGPATAAQLEFMWGLAADAAGYIYICDAWNNCIRKVDPATGGLISTIAGNGVAGFAGDGAAATNAKLNQPTGIYVNGSGELFIADCRNNRIRKVGADGHISTIAGTGTAGFAGDGALAVNAQLYRPLSVYGDDTNGSLYIADLDNVRIRKISLVSLLSFTGGHHQPVAACQNAQCGLDSTLTITDYATGVSDAWSMVSAPLHGSLAAVYNTVSTGGKVVPTGLSYTPVTGYTGSDTFTVRVTNGTLSDTTRVSVSVTPAITSAGIISGTAALCVGATVILTDNISGGTWSCSNANIHLGPSGSLTTLHGLSGGVDTVLYIVSDACSADTATSVVSVLAIPDAGGISGPTSVCVGASVVLTDAATGGTWAGINNAVSVSAGIATGLYPGVGAALYIVNNAACADTAFYLVHVDSLPSPPVISGPGNVCMGAQVALDGGLIRGAWSSDETATATIDPQTGIVMGIKPGVDSVRYSIANACGMATAALGMTVNPLPAVPEILRRENQLWVHGDYSAVQWTINEAAVAGAISDTFTVANSGTYGVIVTSMLGCSIASQPYNYPGCLASDLDVYPNPTTGNLYVDWCDNVSVKILDADGKVVLGTQNANWLNMSGLPDAVYMIAVYDKSGKMIKTKKVSKSGH